MGPLSCWSDLSIYPSLGGRQKLYKHSVYNTRIRVGHLQGLLTKNMPSWCIYKDSQFRILESVREGSLITVNDFKQLKVTQKYLLFLLWLIMMTLHGSLSAAANVTATQCLLRARYKITLKADETITLDRRRENELKVNIWPLRTLLGCRRKA